MGNQSLKSLRKEVKRQKTLLQLETERDKLRSLRFKRTRFGKVVGGLQRYSANVRDNLLEFEKAKGKKKKTADLKFRNPLTGADY